MDVGGTTIVLDQANRDALALRANLLADRDVIRVYDASGGEGPLADLAANEMQRRNLDY